MSIFYDSERNAWKRCGSALSADAHSRMKIRVIIAERLRKQSRNIFWRRMRESGISSGRCGRCLSADCRTQKRRFRGLCRHTGKTTISSISRHRKSISVCIPDLRQWHILQKSWIRPAFHTARGRFRSRIRMSFL